MDPNDQNQQGPADDSTQDTGSMGGGDSGTPTPPADTGTPSEDTGTDTGGSSEQPAPPSPAPSDENGGEEPGQAPAA